MGELNPYQHDWEALSSCLSVAIEYVTPLLPYGFKTKRPQELVHRFEIHDGQVTQIMTSTCWIPTK